MRHSELIVHVTSSHVAVDSIICTMPRASLRSVLLICAFNAARMCRVSTQITGKPASARALNSHCDSGPASNPTRLKR